MIEASWKEWLADLTAGLCFVALIALIIVAAAPFAEADCDAFADRYPASCPQ